MNRPDPRTVTAATQTLWLYACLAITGCGPMTFIVGGSPSQQQLQTTVVQPDGRWASDRVALIDVTGILLNVNKPQLLGAGENPVSLLYEKLREARRDPRVKAVILRLNTPGGTVTATDAMDRLLQRFQHETRKPIVALMMDVAASGGYYLASGADRIVAYPSTVTGSIGVIVQTLSFQPALSRLGIQAEAITSGPNKDVASPLSALTNEHRAVLRSLVDDFYDDFLQVVRERRPHIPPDHFAEVTDGRVMSGKDALSLGLVDQLGDLSDAFSLARQLAGIPSADLILYHRPLAYAGSPYATAASPVSVGDNGPTPPGSATTQINLAQFNLSSPFAETGAEFYYLWTTGW
jgi:protease-4